MKILLDILYWLFFWGTIDNKQINEKLDHFFWKTLCPRPDRSPYKASMFLYNFTGRMAWRFHRRHCGRCLQDVFQYKGLK